MSAAGVHADIHDSLTQASAELQGFFRAHGPAATHLELAGYEDLPTPKGRRNVRQSEAILSAGAERSAFEGGHGLVASLGAARPVKNSGLFSSIPRCGRRARLSGCGL